MMGIDIVMKYTMFREISTKGIWHLKKYAVKFYIFSVGNMLCPTYPTYVWSQLVDQERIKPVSDLPWLVLML